MDDILVIRHDGAVGHGPGSTVLAAPAEAYTRELLDAVPRLDARRTGSQASGGLVLEATGARLLGRGASSGGAGGRSPAERGPAA